MTQEIVEEETMTETDNLVETEIEITEEIATTTEIATEETTEMNAARGEKTLSLLSNQRKNQRCNPIELVSEVFVLHLSLLSNCD